jgi:hypothetical protein
MNVNVFINTVSQNINTEIEKKSNAVVNGVVDQAAYQQVVGYIKGLREAASIIDGVKKRFLYGDDVEASTKDISV